MLITTNTEGRVCGTCPAAIPGVDGIPEKFDIQYMTDWKYTDGVFTYDPIEHPVIITDDERDVMLADLDYRVCLIELGVNEDDL